MAPLQAPGRAGSHARARHSDAGVIVLGTLAKLMIVLAVVGTAGYDAISLAGAHLTVQEDAADAAQAAHDVLAHQGTPQAAYTAALEYATKHEDTLIPDSFTVGKDHSVSLTLTRTAHTIAAAHLPRLKDYVVATADGTAKDPLS